MKISLGDKIRAWIVAAMILNGAVHIAFVISDAKAAPQTQTLAQR